MSGVRVMRLIALGALAGCGGSTSVPSPVARPASPSPGSTATTASPSPAAATATAAGAPAAPTGGRCPAPGVEHVPSSIAASFPTALAPAPDGRLFYAERSGTVRVFQGGTARSFATVSTVTSESGGGYSERGLLGLALSPAFAQDHYVYAFYSQSDRSHQAVVRWFDCAGTGIEPTQLLQYPSGADCCHKGGRIAFGPDGKLYVTLGDEHSVPSPPAGPSPPVPQRTSDVRGKVLRYNPDGSVPGDNPFGAGNPVWAFGLRNPFGIAFSATGALRITDNGPSGEAGAPGSGYDLVETISRGGGHPWPYCYGYGHVIPPYPACPAGLAGPDWSSESSTVVPTGAAFVDAAGPAAYAGRFVFCTLNQGMLVLSPGSPHASVGHGSADCTLDVRQAPDHSLYVAGTSRISRLT
ncbi:MAG: sorbosone dehydrogenase family protein [Candidatus Dormibacteria bacterium]